MPQRKDLRSIPNLNGDFRPPSGLERSICTDKQDPIELLSSSHGKIVSLLLTIPVPYLEERQAPYTSYINIVKEFAVQFPDRQLVLLAETRKQAPDQYEQASIDLLKSSLQGVDLHIITTPKNPKLSFSPWAQDAFLVATNPETSAPGIIVHPSEYPRENRSNDGSIAKEVADRHPAGYTSCTFPAPIEAGNVLVAEDFILVGQDEILRSEYSNAKFMRLFSDFFGEKKRVITLRCKPKTFAPILEDELERHQTRTLNKGDIIVVKACQHSIYKWRGKAQPIFHIDLFITLLGRSSAGKQIILVGEPVAGFDDHFLNRKEKRILDEQIKDATDRINECIKNLKDDLIQHDIPHKIIRNPLPLTYYTYAPLTSWYWASYNNCLVEISGEEKNVWLPRYYSNEDFENPHWKELRKFDKKNEKIFRQNSFNTYLFNHDFHALATNNGALHCMTKCLKRSNHLRESQSATSMSNIELRLHNNGTNNTYKLSVTENGPAIDFPIENNGTQRSEDIKFVRLKIHDGKLQMQKKDPLLAPIMSSKMLLRADKVYIEEIKINKIGDNTVLSIITEDDYRHRVGQNQFDFKLDGVWVSLHVIREEKNHYLIVESSRV